MPGPRLLMNFTRPDSRLVGCTNSISLPPPAEKLLWIAGWALFQHSPTQFLRLPARKPMPLEYLPLQCRFGLLWSPLPLLISDHTAQPQTSSWYSPQTATSAPQISPKVKSCWTHSMNKGSRFSSERAACSI